MRKNLLSIIILALLIVNMIMNALTLFSVMGTNNKTSKLISDIAEAYELEMAGGTGGGVDPTNITVAATDSEPYSLTGGTALNIPLALGEDGRQHYLQLEVELSLDKSHADYAANQPTLDAMNARMKDIVMNVVQAYTYDTVQAAREEIRNEILKQIWGLYGNSTFIYRVDFPVYTPA